MRNLDESWANLEKAMTGGIVLSRPQTINAPKRDMRLRRTLSKGSSINTSNCLNMSRKKLVRSESFKYVDMSMFSRSGASTPLNIHGVSQQNLQKLHQAKCKDLHIKELPNLRQRFQVYAEHHFKNRLLDMRQTGIGQNAALEISKMVKASRTFTSLQLGNNALGDAGAILIAKSMRKNPDIMYLNLSSNGLTPEGVYKICTVLKTSQGLVSLDLSSKEGLNRNRVCLRGAEGLYELLRSSQLLSILNLTGCSLGNNGLRELMEGMAANKSLISINLSSNNITSKHSYMLSRCVLKSKLQSLSLACNVIDEEFAEHLQEMLKGININFCPLRRLDISKCEIHSESMQKILAGLRENIFLETFIADNNPLGPNISYNFSLCFSNNKNLKSLSLHNCRLTDGGCNCFYEILRLNHSIKKLNISKNQITAKGIRPLNLGLKVNHGLQTLDLSENNLGIEGGMTIVKTIKHNNYLENVNLRDCNLRDDAAIILLEAAKMQTNLSYISLDLNPISIKYTDSILAALKRNRQKLRADAPLKITQNISKIKIRENAMEEIQNQFNQLINEEAEEAKRVSKKMNKLRAVREVELAKERESLDELNQVHSLFISASQSLNKHIKDYKIMIVRSENTMNKLRDDSNKLDDINEGLKYKSEI